MIDTRIYDGKNYTQDHLDRLRDIGTEIGKIYEKFHGIIDNQMIFTMIVSEASYHQSRYNLNDRCRVTEESE